MTDYPHRGPVDAAIHGLRRLYGKYTNGQEPSLKVSVGKKIVGTNQFLRFKVAGKSALTVALTADQIKELVMRLSDRSVRIHPWHSAVPCGRRDCRARQDHRVDLRRCPPGQGRRALRLEMA